MKSKVMALANRLVGQGWSRTMAMVKAWATIKLGQIESKVAGISLPDRQKAAEHLTRYSPENISISLIRDRSNQYDKNAVAVMASVNGSRAYQMGYLPKALAVLVAPLMDAGKAVDSAFKAVKGKYAQYMNYGVSIEVRV